MSEEAMDAGVEVKVESEDEVEPYDGTYACGFCSESVRGTAALKCSQCSANPVHWACVAGTKYAGQCATCDGETMQAWNGASAGTAAPSDIIDLTDQEAEGLGPTEVAALTEKRPREDAVPALGGSMVGADGMGRDAGWGRAGAGSGSGGKGKEPAGADAGPEAEGGGAATSSGGGAASGGGKGKGRRDHGSARTRWASSGGESAGSGSGEGRSGRSGGSGGRRAAEGQRGEGSSKRAAPDGDEGGRGRGGKRARGANSGRCEHN